MSPQMNLIQFAEDFRQDIILKSEMDGEESFREDKFVELMIEYLSETGEIDDGMVCSYRGYGMQVNGYSVSENEEVLYLLVAIHEMIVPPLNIKKLDIEKAFKRTIGFYKKCIGGVHASMEEASPVFDLALRVYELRNNLTQVKIILLTDGIAKLEKIEDVEINGVMISHQIWDIERVYRYWSSGMKREVIEIDFKFLFNKIIPCLEMPDDNIDYVSYLAIIPGEILFGIYDKYGPRLLERNVRSFLQARGNVNKGIRRTILDEPHMFLAYNNGISATAEKVEVVRLEDGGLGIKWARDFQIVNGGQTTASIYTTAKKDKADVSRVFVQVKLTVLKDSSKIDMVVPRISEYANSQNKIQTADFSANDPFHVKVEEFSRIVWAPPLKGTHRQTRWFYERARGQYADQKSREGTPARRKTFEIAHPSSQKFTKTELAKYENTWNQKPFIVSKGAQANFRDFTVQVKERGGFQVNQKYFEHFIAKAILFKRTEKLVQEQQYGGYRANIVTYTVALLSNATAQRINLDRIWQEQGLSPILEKAIVETSKVVFHHIVNAPGGANVTEWCKKEQCWKKLLENSFEIPKNLRSELVSYDRRNEAGGYKGIDGTDTEDTELVNNIMTVSAETWYNIASWSRETTNLLPWQRKLAFSLGKLASNATRPSRKQAIQGEKIIEEAIQRGFKID